MKDKKGKHTQKDKQSKQKQKETPGCLSFGKLDLIYKIEFAEKDLEKPEKDENGEKYLNIEDINSIKDLEFIKDKKAIWDKITLRANNATLEQLLIANKMSKKKMNVEYIGYGRPKFEGDEEFFSQIFNYVNEKNHFELNDKSFVEDGPYSLKFELVFKDKTHDFSIGSGGEDKEEKKEEEKPQENNEEKPPENNEGNAEEKPKENTEEKKEESKDNKKDEKKKEEEPKPDEYEPNDAMKEEKIPKFSRKDTVLCNLNPKNKKYALFYLNFDEVKDIPGNFEQRDLIELIYFLKKKGAKIFVNYYKPPEEPKEEEEEEKNQNKDNEIEGETYDMSGKINEKEKQRKKERKEDEEDAESKEEKEMKFLNNLYYLTDLYFFDFKQAIEEFNRHYKIFTSDKPNKSINKQKLHDYFISGIASGTKKEVDGDKYGFFLEDCVKYYVIHANKKKAKKNEFDCQLFPKINHNNINLIEEYKNIIKKNVNNYVSIFVTFIISGVASTGSVSNEVIMGAFLNALELVKRKVECEKNNINLTEKELMKFKLSEKNLADRIKELNLGNQEDDFVLDCTNKEKSELKEYVPLYDYHLVYYFRSDVNQKELKKKGFINDKGFIMYDPVHRKRMRNDLISKKLNEEETQKKVESNIMNIDIGSRIKDKEIDSSKINKDNNLATIKKLPKSKYGIVKKKEKKTKKKENKEKNENDNEQSSGSDNEEEKKDNNETNEKQEPNAETVAVAA